MARQHLTTSEAAEMCNVTRFTIANWAKKGRLKSTKTAGGHRRISKKHLLRFIEKNNIAEVDKKNPQLPIPSCWKFSFKDRSKHNCLKCLVYKEKANKCFLLIKELGSEKVRCVNECFECEYIATYYPAKKKAIERMKNGAIGGFWSGIVSREEEVPAFLKKGLYVSGKYIGSIKKALSKERRKTTKKRSLVFR